VAAGLLCGSASAGDNYEPQRRAMVEQQIKQRGITKPEVLAAMEQVPRHLFVPDSLREEALRGFTLDAAWSLFLDKEVGSLEVGKRADLVVFAQDPMTVPEREIPRAAIDYTVVEGQVVYERGTNERGSGR